MNESNLKPQTKSAEISSLKVRINQLEQRYAEAEEALDAIRSGAVDALVVYTLEGEKIYTIQGAETTYRLMIETLNEGTATLIEDGTILYCNRHFAEMLATPLEAIIGTSIHQYFPPEHQSVFSSLLSDGIKNNCQIGNCRAEVELMNRQGTRIPVMVSIANFSSIGIPGVCLVATDLTDRKIAVKLAALVEQKTQAEEKLQRAYDELEQRVQERTKELKEALDHEQTMRLQLIQAEKLSALNRMLATVVHELNNPIQTIKNCLYLARLDTPADSSLLDPLDIADSEINRINKLVLALRDIYRQPKNIDKEYLEINKLISDVHTLLNPHLQHQNVAWQLEASADPLMIYGITDHLKQVFLNISMNAIEAMQPGGGTLTIQTVLNGESNEVIVRITDTGCGIDPANMEKIFEPFFTTKEGGSGLGLLICYEIVQKHAGRISVESQPGKGTTFTIYLPTAKLAE